MKTFLCFLLVMLPAAGISSGQEKKAETGKKQYLYLLRLEKTMTDPAAWTPEKNKIVQDHFVRLQKMLSDRTLILAGRTQVELDKTIGIVIYEADSFDEAKTIAENDPAVKAGIMTVEVFPYEVALMREGIKK